MSRRVRIALAILVALIVAPALVALAWSTANAGPYEKAIASLQPEDTIAVDLWLIGDAGLPKPGGEPVLKAISAQIKQIGADSALVVFLGDNIYPKGLPDTTGQARREAERIIDAQIEAVRDAEVQAVFVPGNHDWEAGGEVGWRTVFRQGQYIDAKGKGKIAMLPRFGCPGPEVYDFGPRLRILFLDTQWWLHRYAKPSPADLEYCKGLATEKAVIDSIRKALASAGDRATVVTGHHPLISGGIHGGYYDWPSYLVFPIPLARKQGFAPQDVAHPRYKNLKRAMERAFGPKSPLLYAAGHEHNLQILRSGNGAQNLVVSGAGIYDHTTAVSRTRLTRFATEESGYMRMSILKDGRIRLAVIVVEADASSREVASVWLREKPQLPRGVPADSAGTAAPPEQTTGLPPRPEIRVADETMNAGTKQ